MQKSFWKAWMQEQFIPACMETACFNEFRFYELEVEPTQAPTYTLQLFASSKRNNGAVSRQTRSRPTLQATPYLGRAMLSF